MAYFSRGFYAQRFYPSGYYALGTAGSSGGTSSPPPYYPAIYYPPLFYPVTYYPSGTAGSSGTVSSPPPYYPVTYYPSAYFAGAYYPDIVGSTPVYLTFRRSLVAALKGSSAITAIVGSKVYPLKVPETQAGPWVLYHVDSIDRGHTLDGSSGMSVAAVKIGCGSKNQANCEALSEACRNLLDGFVGRLGGSSGVLILETISGDEQDLYEPPVDASDSGTFWIVLPYTFRYHESLPTHS